MAETILKIINLTKNFGGVIATNNVSFNLQKGEKLGILGPNGAGKTTLFNQVSGFISPNEGDIIYKGESIKKYTPNKRADLGIVRTFQIVRPFHDMTVAENLIVPFMSKRGKRILKQSGKTIYENVEEILQKVGLINKKDYAVGQIPHGELKKLEVAKVSALKPDIIMLDEPFGGLSVTEIDRLTEYINHLNEKQNISFIIIEHRLREFMKVVQRLIVLNYGELIAHGTPDEIVQNPLVIEAYLGKGGGNIASA